MGQRFRMNAITLAPTKYTRMRRERDLQLEQCSSRVDLSERGARGKGEPEQVDLYLGTERSLGCVCVICLHAKYLVGYVTMTKFYTSLWHTVVTDFKKFILRNVSEARMFATNFLKKI